MKSEAVRRFNGLKRRAKDRDIRVELTLDQFKQITAKPCVYCGRFTKGKKHTGVDRIDSNLDYTLSNSAPCCRFCNLAKNDLSVEEFVGNVLRVCLFQFAPEVLAEPCSRVENWV